ncbi:MAG: response regulator [Nitrososphaerales archaeon]
MVKKATTIMLVDDEVDVLAVTKRMLENGGYAVHSFDNPEAALHHVRNEGCRACILVVSDIRMPGMSGFDLVRRIKEVLPDLKVILTSSFVIHTDEFRKVMPSLHVDDFVRKPFTSSELLEAIKRFRQGLEGDG